MKTNKTEEGKKRKEQTKVELDKDQNLINDNNYNCETCAVLFHFTSRLS